MKAVSGAAACSDFMSCMGLKAQGLQLAQDWLLKRACG